MAIGTTAALIGSAVIGAGASLASSSANNKQINAASAQTAADNAASRALQQQIYEKNNALLSPYNVRGNAAGDQMNALLGLGGGSSDSAGGSDWNSYLQANPDVQAGYAALSPQDKAQFPTVQDYAQYHYGAYGQNEARALPVTSPTGDASTAANNAFDLFKNSTGYQFRVDQGQKSMNALAAANGSFDSGAAVKSALNYGQGVASQEFGNYMGYLGNQQGVGLSAASAVAGVGQNYANGVTAINGANSQNAWNTAQAKTQSNNSLASNLTSSFGKIGGALSGFGTSTAGGWNGSLPSSTLPDIWSIKL